MDQPSRSDLSKVLLIFDIDGTMIDSTRLDDACFLETLHDTFGFELDQMDWNKFEHVTDQGITKEIYKSQTGSDISKEQLQKVQDLFSSKISQKLTNSADEVKAVHGIQAFLAHLDHLQLAWAIATGGWRTPAEIKLRAAGIEYNPFNFASANDAVARRSIMNIAFARTQYEWNRKFDHILYFGDNLWDARTCASMEIPFIGIDIHKHGHLSNTTAKAVFSDFLDIPSLIKTIYQYIQVS